MDEKLKAFWAKLNSSFTDLWKNNKIFLIVFGILIVIVKFRGLLIDLIVASSKKLLENTVTKDARLAKEEDEAKAKADALVKKAADEGKNLPPIGNDWNKK